MGPLILVGEIDYIYSPYLLIHIHHRAIFEAIRKPSGIQTLNVTSLYCRSDAEKCSISCVEAQRQPPLANHANHRPRLCRRALKPPVFSS